MLEERQDNVGAYWPLRHRGRPTHQVSSDMARPDKPHRARPRDNPFSPSSNSQNAAFRFGDTTNPRADFTFRHRHAPRIYERDLLTRQPNTIETSVLASNHGENRFKDPNDLSDSGEEDMEYSSDDHPVDRAKRRKLDEPTTTTTSSPATTLKWSNPDPYTACPPPEETVGKRIDMVKYIRKARNEAAVAPAPSAAQEDFISFDFADDPTFGPPPNAPLGPKADMGSANSRDDVHIVAVTEIGGRSTLGKRKRDDKPDRDTLRQRVARAGGAILDDWAQEGKSSTTPWLRPIKPTDSAIVALHREIVDFYEWVRPREFEFDVRQGVIDKLSKELRRKEHGNLEPFGSYAAGLFLPIGDMDLVYNLSRWRGTEEPVSKNMIYRYRDFLERIDVAEPGSILPIAHAKVPIIKYVDKATGLRVDLSFNSRTGTSAVSTFQKWKAAYPAMPIIVSVVKQMLMIRGLNDVATGGIGGFSIICLVTSFLQHLPGHRACNLGEVLVEFCNLYGNLFDRSVVGIRLDPPSYVDKVEYAYVNFGRSEKPDRLMIIDPNRADNNISGGTSSIATIFALFAQSHATLQESLDSFAERGLKDSKFSFLEKLIGGNFSAYDEQRQRLRHLHAQTKDGKNGVR